MKEKYLESGGLRLAEWKEWKEIMCSWLQLRDLAHSEHFEWNPFVINFYRQKENLKFSRCAQI